MDRNLITARAALDYAERLTNAVREADPEGLKRFLDAEAERLEGLIARDPRHPMADVARAELDLVSKVFRANG